MQNIIYIYILSQLLTDFFGFVSQSAPKAAPYYTFIQTQEREKNMRRQIFPGQPLGQLVVALNEARNAL